MLLMTMIVVLAACGDQDNSSNAEQEGNNTEQKSQTAEEETKNETEELSILDVIEKSVEALDDWEGWSTDLDTTQMINASTGGEEFSMEQNMSMKTEMTRDPVTMYMDGVMKMDGQENAMESYFVDGKMYTKSGQTPWIAVEGMDLTDMQQQTQGNNPAEMMEQFTEMIEALSEEGNGDDTLKMEVKDGMYVVNIKLDEESSASMMDIIKEQSQEVVEQLEVTGIPNIMENMKINSLNQTLYIDEETFEQQKVEQQMKMEIEIDGNSITIDQDMEAELQEEITEEITVPEDVKSNAQVITMEQLQQAQQQQQ